MKVSIIIPSYNGIELIKKCLKSLEDNTPSEYLDDIIVVDNDSTDGTAEFLKTQHTINVIFNKKNLGFSKACNQGAKEAKGEVLIFLNNDTEPQKGWLEPLLLALANKETAVAGSKLLFPNGRIQHAGIVISNKYIPQHIYYNKKADLKYVNKVREFQAVTAACMAVRKTIFDQVGGFDEGYINGLEDVDLCLKIREKGYKAIYCPESVVTHHEAVAPGRFNEVGHNEELFLKKWKDKIVSDEDRYYKEDGLGKLYSLKRIVKDRIKREIKKIK